MAGQVTVTDLEYQPGLLARVYQPAGEGPFPLLLDVHGGGWNNGDRTNNEPIDTWLAEHGIAIAAVDFRMPPASRYPDNIADINLAARWLKANAQDFKSLPERVGWLGTSSGGHMAALAALRPFDPRYTVLPLEDAPGAALPEALEGRGGDARLACLVACWPVVDPLARYRMVKAAGRESMVKGHQAYWGSEAAMEEGNPVLLLERGEKVELPPAIVIQGTNDDNVTPDMADRFVAAYRKAGGSIELRKYEGQPHSFIKRGGDGGAAAQALEDILEFVQRTLSP